MKEKFCFLDLPENKLDCVINKVEENKPDLAEKLKPITDEKEFFKVLWENYNIAFVNQNQMGQKVITYVDIDDYKDNPLKLNYVLESIIQEFHRFLRDGSSIDPSHLPCPAR